MTAVNFISIVKVEFEDLAVGYQPPVGFACFGRVCPSAEDTIGDGSASTIETNDEHEVLAKSGQLQIGTQREEDAIPAH
jgi:hypothetical protein